MEVGEERVGEEGVVDQVEVHAQHLEDGEHDVETVGDVEGGEDVVEAVLPHLLAQQHHDADQVTEETNTAES